MATTNNRGGNRTSNRGRTGQNNNPEGHNQFDRGLLDSARERPFTAAAAIGGAVAAGVFLWSKRNQISDQISDLSEQLNEWREGSGSDRGFGSGSFADDSQGFIARSGRKGAKSQSDIAEEALTLKETGKKNKRPSDPTIDQQTKVGAVAY